MNKILDDIMTPFKNGEKTDKETTEALRAAGLGIYVDNGKLALTPEEMDASTGGPVPNGWGMMDDGITVKKIRVVEGKVENKLFDPPAPGFVPAPVYITVDGEKYKVADDGLTLEQMEG